MIVFRNRSFLCIEGRLEAVDWRYFLFIRLRVWGTKMSCLITFLCPVAGDYKLGWIEVKLSYSGKRQQRWYYLSEFPRQSLVGFRTIVFIFIVISTTFRPICLPAFFRCLSNSGTFTELRITSFIVLLDTWRNSYRGWFPKLLRRQSSGSCRFNPDCRRITIQEYLTLVIAKGIRTGDPRGFIKGRSS